VVGAIGGEVVPAGSGRVAVVCAPDAAFGAEVPAAIGRLTIPAFVAGKPGAHEAALRAAGARGFVALGQDVVAFGAALRSAASGEAAR
jgi:methylmalonyl-CoA mutase